MVDGAGDCQDQTCLMMSVTAKLQLCHHLLQGRYYPLTSIYPQRDLTLADEKYMASPAVSEPLPPTVSELLANRDKARARYPIQRPFDWRTSRAFKPSIISRLRGGRPPDSPSASFYRIYEFFVLGWTTAFRNELEYFCCSHPDWSVSGLPDPADSDPTRYASLAVLTRLMCASFNRRIEQGLPRDAPAIIIDFAALRARTKAYEAPPGWADHVAALEEKVFIPDAGGKELPEDDPEVSEEFKAMNIIAQMPHIHFV